LGTKWESDGDPLGTERKHVGNKEKMKKNLPTPLPQNLKENKSMHFECMLSLSIEHWVHEISISKTVRHYFWPGLIPPL